MSDVERAEHIVHDCRETVVCEVDRGNQLVSDDPVADCIEYSTELLEQSAMLRASFDENFGRCAELFACEYLDCVVGPGQPASYGESQIDEITYACEAKVMCDVQRGNTPGEYPLRDCLAGSHGPS